MNARREISIGVTIRVRVDSVDGDDDSDIDLITEIGIGLIKNGNPEGYCVVLQLNYADDIILQLDEGIR